MKYGELSRKVVVGTLAKLMKSLYQFEFKVTCENSRNLWNLHLIFVSILRFTETNQRDSHTKSFFLTFSFDTDSDILFVLFQPKTFLDMSEVPQNFILIVYEKCKIYLKVRRFCIFPFHTYLNYMKDII